MRQRRPGGGRKPKPDALKALEGNPGKRRRKPDPAPVPQGAESVTVGIARLAVPAPPRQMTKDAALEWRRLAPDLIKLGLLRRLDMSAFEARCELYATWLRCRRKITRGGITYEHNGLQRQRPEVRLAQDCLRQIRQYDSDFGLNPAARARVAHVTGEQPGQAQLPLGDQPAPDPNETARGDSWSDDAFFRGPAN
jgi:P27 family predicted phage terminase small subunit